MAEEEKRKRLGRGLDALFGEDRSTTLETEPTSSNLVRPSITTAPIEALAPGKHQPRSRFDSKELIGLAGSIKEKGILQPILVRKNSRGTEKWEIIAGERRWRAAQLAQIHEVPILVRELTDSEALEAALVENLQRENLSPLEEAEGYRRLIQEFSHSKEALGEILGKSRSHVANMIRLLNLPNDVQALLNSGSLSVGHARALLNADNPGDLAQTVVKLGLNVRQTEKLAKKAGVKNRTRSEKSEKDADTLALERTLSESIGLKVSIQITRPGGNLIIAYQTLEQLDDILLRLKKSDVVDSLPGSPSPTENLTSLVPNILNHKGSETGASLSDEVDAAIAQLDAGANVREDNMGEGVLDEQVLNFNLSDHDLEQLISEK